MVKKQRSAPHREDFVQKLQHAQSALTLLCLHPDATDVQLQEQLCASLQAVAPSARFYRDDCGPLADSLVRLLRDQANGGADLLGPKLRLALCQVVVQFRNHGVLSSLAVLQLFFELIKCPDKILRKYLFSSIISHIKQLASGKGGDQKVRTDLQNYVFAKVKDARSIVSRMAVLLLIDAYRKRLWNDAKTANAIAECCFNRNTRIQVSAIKFFLGVRRDEVEQAADASDSDEDGGAKAGANKTIKEVLVGYRVGKKTSKRKKHMEKAKKDIAKEAKRKKGHTDKDCNFAAMQQLYDAQAFAERLFRSLEGRAAERFEVRLLKMALLARLIGTQQLLVLGFYSYIQRYLTPHQREVTRVLLYAAQSAHELVPPDVLQSLLRRIVDQFVSERNSAEAIAVGLNAVRLILQRCPFAVDDDTLRDLAEYKRYKNKNVTSAARSIIQLYRVENPKLLKKTDRGRPTLAAQERPIKQYGAMETAAAVPGAEVLARKRRRLHDSVGDEEPAERDTQQSAASTSASAEPQKDLTEALSTGHIFDDKEHRKIARWQLAKAALPAKKRKRQRSDSSDNSSAASSGESDSGGDEEEPDNMTTPQGLPTLAAVEHLHKKPRRHSKEERMQAIQEGREGRDKFGRPKRAPHAGRTNRQNAKGKHFMMVRAKHRGKKRQRSYGERQRALSNALKRKHK